MAKEIDLERLKKKADDAQKRIKTEKENEEKEKALHIEHKAQKNACKWIEEIPQRLEDAADRGVKKVKIFWYSVMIGGGYYTETAIDERTLELIEEYCKEQGLKTYMKDGQWNAPGAVQEYKLYVDLT
ncbi:MAG: hypothetical protein R3251_00430 [Candidatus Spechtbacterales bacterium]|nr:hypothetical protein [Candidatus Spechtbacterales bacterium]